MGMVFGKIGVETPKFQVLKSTSTYEIRRYPPSVVAQITYHPSQLGGDQDGGFTILANYIGAFGRPNNTKPEKIAMTAPVITSEKIAMTVPVITSEKIAMTTPVITSAGEASQEENNKKAVTMQFILPSKYTRVEEVPKPTDERIVTREEGEKTYGVITFSGVTSDKVVQEKVEKLKESLNKDGHKVIGDFLLARYNPPWTLPPFRKNEVRIPVEVAENI